jgi:uncharacterized membrane protein YgdD (TMEM256/DUF423 family)
MYHSIALMFCHFARIHGTPKQQAWVDYAGYSFLFGITVFSGSLYALVLSNVKKLGMITPIGGFGLIGGWLLLAVASQY